MSAAAAQQQTFTFSQDGFAELNGLVYDLNGGPLGDGQVLDIEGIAADDATFSYQAGPRRPPYPALACMG